jgi:mRNA-degrading endonuclease toxin of MazEF toxin-antitoxin module
MTMSFEQKIVFYFDCDQRGKNTHCCGVKNSSGGFERPFLIVSDQIYNKSCNDDGVYVVPLTTKGSGNNFSYTIGNDTFEDSSIAQALKDSIILCDKICRVSRTDLNAHQTKGLKIKYSEYARIRKLMKEFIDRTF